MVSSGARRLISGLALQAPDEGWQANQQAGNPAQQSFHDVLNVECERGAGTGAARPRRIPGKKPMPQPSSGCAFPGEAVAEVRAIQPRHARQIGLEGHRPVSPGLTMKLIL